jgi:hypothetical protein
VCFIWISFTILLQAQFFTFPVDFLHNGPAFSFPDISLGILISILKVLIDIVF